MAESTTEKLYKDYHKQQQMLMMEQHYERFSLDGQVRKVGLRREEGCRAMDSE